MLFLREEEHLTLQEIADCFHITRERVRQIVGNSGNVNYSTVRRRTKARKMLTLANEELANELGVVQSTVSKYRQGLHHAVKEGDSTVYAHHLAQEKVGRILMEKGFTVKHQPMRCDFNILVNGWAKVQVAVANQPNTPPSSVVVSPQWKFALARKNKRGRAWDFLCCVTGEGDIFIIPSESIPRSYANLAFCYPTLRPSLGKYQKYKDRYDLLIRGDS